MRGLHLQLLLLFPAMFLFLPLTVQFHVDPPERIQQIIRFLPHTRGFFQDRSRLLDQSLGGIF